MKTLIRSVFVVAVLAVALATFRTVALSGPTPSPDATPSPVSSPSEQPSAEPSEQPAPTPDESPEVVGVLKFVDGVAVGGPGIGVGAAIDSGFTDPVLVNGVFFRTEDGALFLAGSLTDAAAPTFGGPVLRIEGYPHVEAQWDLANADLTGLQEANGILFFEDAQLFGAIEA